MSNNKGSENKNLLNPADLEKVTGGSAWNDDAEEMERVRLAREAAEQDAEGGTSAGHDPVAGAGIMDRLAHGLDHAKVNTTDSALRK